MTDPDDYRDLTNRNTGKEQPRPQERPQTDALKELHDEVIAALRAQVKNAGDSPAELALLTASVVRLERSRARLIVAHARANRIASKHR